MLIQNKAHFYYKCNCCNGSIKHLKDEHVNMIMIDIICTLLKKAYYLVKEVNLHKLSSFTNKL